MKRTRGGATGEMKNLHSVLAGLHLQSQPLGKLQQEVPALGLAHSNTCLKKKSKKRELGMGYAPELESWFGYSLGLTLCRDPTASVSHRKTKKIRKVILYGVTIGIEIKKLFTLLVTIIVNYYSTCLLINNQ